MYKKNTSFLIRLISVTMSVMHHDDGETTFTGMCKILKSPSPSPKSKLKVKQKRKRGILTLDCLLLLNMKEVSNNKNP